MRPECDIKISIEDVCRFLDIHKKSDSYEELLEELKEMLPMAYEKIEPMALLEFGSLDGYTVEEEGRPIKEALFGICTVGKRMAEWSTQLFAEGDYMRGMMADAIADNYLFQMDTAMEQTVIDMCRKQGKGIIRRIEAPQDIPMSIQKRAYDATGAEQEGIGIKPSFMYDPVKTVCQIYLLDDDTAFHACILARTPGIVHPLVPYLYRLRLDRFDIWVQFRHIEFILPVYDIDFPVVVKEQPRVVEIFRKDSPCPRSFRLLGFADREVPLFRSPSSRRAERHIEFSVVITDRISPRTIQIQRPSLHVVARVFVIAFHGINRHLPVYQVFVFEYRRSRHIMHTCRYHIKSIFYSNNIRVRPIPPQQRIGKAAVSIIRAPHLLGFSQAQWAPQKCPCHDTRFYFHPIKVK